MTKISQERLARYRELAKRELWDFKEPKASAIFQRMEEEGCTPVDYAFNYFMGMFHAPLTQDITDVDIALVGVTMENSVPERSGQKYGPSAVRRWSYKIGPIHHITGVVPFDMCNIIDYGDVDISKGLDIRDRIESIHETFLKLADHNISTLTVGGEHTMTYPILKALGRKEPLGLIHIDAHGDTWGNIGGADINDANMLRNAVVEGIVDPERTISLGLRGRCFHFWDFSSEVGIRVVSAEEFRKKGPEVMAEEARKIVGDGPCYLTFDVDALDPVFMPGTGLPEPFGLTSLEVCDFIRELRGMDFVGADIAEICPPADPTDMSANTGAGFCFEMLCLLCESHVARPGVTRKTHWKK